MKRKRIDWMPGKAAQAVLSAAEARFPQLGQQALIDKLVICGWSALEHEHWQEPALHGRNRDRWLVQRFGRDIPVECSPSAARERNAPGNAAD